MTEATDDVEAAESDEEKIERLATRYLESVRNKPDEDRMAKLEEQIADREKRRDKLVDQHGEEHRLVQKAEEAIEKVKAERNELRESAEETEQSRNELLEVIAGDPGFEFNDTWLSGEAIQAVTHALYEQEDDLIVVHNREVRNQSDVAELDEFDVIEMEHIIVSLAEDRLSGNDTVEDSWERVTDSVAFPAVKVLAQSGPMASRKVADELDEQSSTIKDRLGNFFKTWDEFVPIYRVEQGIYGTSTTGKYLFKNYSEVDWEGTSAGEVHEEMEGDPSDQIDEDSSEQTTMDNLTEEKGKGSESEESESDSESDSEPADLNEKAEEMFSEVGEDGT